MLCEIDIDECENNLCLNGDCVDGIGEYACSCFEDYTGRHCDKRKKSTCADSPCENSGICRDVALQSNGVSFQCECAQGYEGEYCSERIDHCKNVSCKNGAKCINNLFGATCECLMGYNGPLCEVDINECESNPCVRGVCHDEVATYSCDCTDTGFTGMDGY